MRLPSVRNAEEIVDYLFSDASTVQTKGKDDLQRMRKKFILKLHRISDRADMLLSSYVTGFPSFSGQDFLADIASLLVDVDELRICISRVHRMKNNVVATANRYARHIAGSRDSASMQAVAREAYGRIASMIRERGKDLEFLAGAASRLREIPEVREYRTVIVAGFPNAGKSTLVSRITGARTKIADYPFTTTQLIMGTERMEDGEHIQFLDSPGLTERAFETSNANERKALIAIRRLSGLLLFVVDPAAGGGYDMKTQLELLEGIREDIGPSRLLVAYSKSDLVKVEGLSFSAVTGEGMEELMHEIRKRLDLDVGTFSHANK